MRLGARAFTSSRFALPLALVALAAAVGPTPSSSQPYWMEYAANATTGIYFLGPGIAALSAWDFGSLHTSGVLAHSLLPHYALPLRRAAWVAVVASATWVLGLFAQALRFGWPHALTSGDRVIAPLVALIAVCSSCSLVGMALARYLPRTLAATLTAVGTWALLGVPPSIEPVWLRNVTGNQARSCCALYNSMPWAPTLAVLSWACPLALLAVTLLLRPTRPVLAAAATTSLVLGVLGARSLVQDFGHDPVQPRTDALTCFENGDTRVCLWPESATDTTRRSLNSAINAARRMRVPLPATITEQPAHGPDAVTIVATASTELEARRSLALALAIPCPVAQSDGTAVATDEASWAAAEALSQWLHQRYVHEEPSFTPDPKLAGALTRRVAAMPPSQQERWVAAHVRAAFACTTSADTL